MKHLFKKNKQSPASPPNPKVPRTAEEIQKEFNELCARAGHANYQAKLHEQQVNQILSRISEVNQEALERQKLDRETQEATQKVEVTSV